MVENQPRDASGSSPGATSTQMGAREGSGLPGFDPQRLWQIARRRRFYLLLPVVVIGVVLGAGMQTITPVYIADSRILLETKTTGTAVDQLMTQEARRVRDEENLVMVKETVFSRRLLERIIRNLRLKEDPLVLEQAQALQDRQLPDQTIGVIAERILVARLRNKINVGGRRGNLFIISVEDNDPHTAYKLTESLTQGFIDEITQRGVDEMLVSTSFTDEQLESARAQLRVAEEKLENFKRTRLIQEQLSGNPVTRDNNRRAETLLRLVRLDISENRRELSEVEGGLLQRLGALPQSAIIERDPELLGLRDRLITLEREDYLGQLATASGGRDPSGGNMSAERQRIGVQRNRLTQRINTLVDREFAQHSALERASLSRRYELIFVNDVLLQYESQASREFSVYETMVKEGPALEVELGRLETEVATKEEVYNKLISAEISNEFRLAASESGFGFNVRIIEPAKKPLFPAKPSKAKIAIMGMVLALGIGMGAVFLSEYVDTSFKDVEDVRHYVGLEVLGTLPRFAEEFQWERSKRRTIAMWRTAFVVTLVTIMVLFVLYYRRSTVQDRVNLMSMSDTSSPRVGEMSG